MIILALTACSGPGEDLPTPGDTATVERPNVLILVADDLGLDNVGAYQAHPDHANTPHIDALAAEGVRFTTTWATPTCSPARAQILTGRHGRRYGMGIRIDMRGTAAPFALREGEVTLGELAKAAGYSTSFVGKWHLNSYALDWEMAPLRQGFDWFAISGGNLPVPSTPALASYYHWERNENGNIAFTDTYATIAQTDDAVARIEAMPEPWLMVVAFNAPHEPFQAPPQDQHTLGVVANSPIPVRYRAAVEALDTGVGRIVASIPPEMRDHTHIVFVADNGTPKEAVLDPLPSSQGKPSLTEGGLRVPLVVTGPGIEPGVSDAMTGLVDLFPTVAEWVGADPDVLGMGGAPLDLDGIPLSPWLEDPAAPDGRTHLYADRFGQYDHPDTSNVLEQTVRTRRWKYVLVQGMPFLFDLETNPVDLTETDLLLGGSADPAVLTQMEDTLAEAIAERPFDY